MENAGKWTNAAGATNTQPSSLGISDGVNVELLGPLNLHLVAKDAVNDRSCWMISYSRPISVLGVSLFPYSSIFQTDQGPAGQSVKGSIHTADK